MTQRLTFDRPKETMRMDPFLRAEDVRERSARLARSESVFASRARRNLPARDEWAASLKPATRQGAYEKLDRARSVAMIADPRRFGVDTAPWYQVDDALDSIRMNRADAANAVLMAADAFARHDAPLDAQLFSLQAYFAVKAFEDNGGAPDDSWFAVRFKNVVVSDAPA